ncbi:hypothetical protein C1H46_042563 [Malus baccata]|uniref:Glucose-methanol-choline oxidoreductase N-terminal domain-containing protein n=1 Tax=Malus baccata TaxID=106549 RepID=A0A540KCT5_MALBA|nr:hypothetical protein C1H46_042563 [Malus baccata]
MSAISSVLLLLVLYLQSEVHSLATPSDHVGGGTSGCPLAATLSANYSVLVLERGSLPTSYPNVLTQDGFAYNLQQEDDGTTPVQRIMSEDGIPTVRGRLLGGTSMINAGVYARANMSFYNQSGIEWDMELVNNTYEWVEY